MENYDHYCQLSAEDTEEFPPIPHKTDIMKLNSFEKKFCENFNSLESSDSNIITGFSVYFNLINLAQDPQFCQFDLEQIIVAELYPLVFCDAAAMYCFFVKIKPQK